MNKYKKPLRYVAVMNDIKSSLLTVPGLERAANGPTDELDGGSPGRSRSSSVLNTPRSRSGSFLAPRKKTASAFTMNLNFRKLPEEEDGPLGSVHYKMDGERFGESRTLKLQTQSKYRVDVHTKPDLDIQTMSIEGNGVTLKRVIKIADDDDDASDAGAFYEGEWEANLHITKDGTRHNQHITVEVENCGTVQYTIQCKIYKHSDDHVVWGKPLHAIELECVVKNDSVQIKNDLFR